MLAVGAEDMVDINGAESSKIESAPLPLSLPISSEGRGDRGND